MEITRRTRAMLAIMVLGTLCSTSSVSAGDAAFLDAQSLIAGWKAHYGGIHRMHFRLSDRVIDVNDNKGSVGLENLVRFQIADLTIDRDTKRFHLRYSRNEGGLDEPLKIHESAFNGKTTQQYWGDGPRRRGRISSGPIGTTPAILEASLRRYLLADSVGAPVDAQGRGIAYIEWVSGMIGNTMESGKPCTVVKPNLEMVSREPCHVLELVHDGKVMSKTWFAHDKGMLPMRFQMFLDDGKLGHEIVVLDTAKVETDTDVTWYPSKATQLAIVGAYDNSGNIVYGTVMHQLQVFEFTPNVEVDESTFHFEMPAGTEVRDDVAGVDYTVGYLEPPGLDLVGKPGVSQSPAAVDANTSNQPGQESHDEVTVAGKESKDSTIRMSDVKTILCCSVLVCAMLVMVIFASYRRTNNNDTGHKTF